MGFLISRPARGAQVCPKTRYGKGSPKSNETAGLSEQNFTPDIDGIWRLVDTLALQEQSLPNQEAPIPGEWKTIRVFVSSTFDDFYSEREILVKKVFPELKEWCEARGLTLVECDLRWGIPKDSSSTVVIGRCLEELDRCRQDTYGKPLMLILVGNRVGWIPSPQDVSPDIMAEYQWVPGMSITGMEIVHGAYRNCNPNAFFCFRDSSFIKMLPADMLHRFQDANGGSQEFLSMLKEKLCSRFPKDQMLHYNCQVNGTDESSGIQKVQLEGLEDFSSSALQFLQKRICQTFPESKDVLAQRANQYIPSWQQVEEAQHRLYLQQKCQLVLGRQQEVDAVLAFLQAATQDLQERQKHWRESMQEHQEEEQADITEHSKSETKEGKGELPHTITNLAQKSDDSGELSGSLNNNVTDVSLHPDSSMTQMQYATSESPEPESIEVLNKNGIRAATVVEGTEARKVFDNDTLPGSDSCKAFVQDGTRTYPDLKTHNGTRTPPVTSSSNEQTDDGGTELLALEQISPFLITSHPGTGKSALMAMCIKEAQKVSQFPVFFHFVGCSPSSVDLVNLVQRLCCHLMVDKQAKEEVLEKLKEAGSKEILREILKEQLTDAWRRSLFPVIFIDAINQLSLLSDTDELLAWLLDIDLFPPTCRCVISTTDLRVTSPFMQQLDPLSAESAHSLAVTYLKRFNKSLSPDQLELLMLKHSSQNPLWLTLACEELRVFGVFERVTQLIKGFPDNLQGLLSNIVNRLVRENTMLVKEFLCLLHFCINGVLESDIQQVLAQRNGYERLPMMHWAEVRRVLKSFLRFGRNAKGRDMVAFFHSSVAEAVKQCLLAEKEVQQGYLQSLADFYEHTCGDDALVVLEVPRLLKEGCFNARLVNFLRKDPRARFIPANVKYKYLKELRCTQPCGPGFMRQPALICSFCALRSGAFGQLFLNGKSCVMCGQTVLTHGKEAYICHLHHRFGLTECFICKSHIHIPKSAVPARLCHYCAIFSWCVVIKI